MFQQDTRASRRALLTGVPALAVVALGAAPVPALSGPADLPSLIAAHKSAWTAFIKADEGDDAFTAQNDRALDALLSYRCRSMDEISAKAAYLATTCYVIDGVMDPEHIQAFVNSMIGGVHV